MWQALPGASRCCWCPLNHAQQVCYNYRYEVSHFVARERDRGLAKCSAFSTKLSTKVPTGCRELAVVRSRSSAFMMRAMMSMRAVIVSCPVCSSKPGAACAGTWCCTRCACACAWLTAQKANLQNVFTEATRIQLPCSGQNVVTAEYESANTAQDACQSTPTQLCCWQHAAIPSLLCVLVAVEEASVSFPLPCVVPHASLTIITTMLLTQLCQTSRARTVQEPVTTSFPPASQPHSHKRMQEQQANTAASRLAERASQGHDVRARRT